MTAVRARSRARARTRARHALLAGLLCALPACGTDDGSPARPPTWEEQPWEEPAAYAYTLKSAEGERALIGTFRVTVRDGVVTEAVGLDDSARRAMESAPEAVPTLGELLAELALARQEGAAKADAEYASDGHPVRIALDRAENTVDDEALYVITAYEPSPRA